MTPPVLDQELYNPVTDTSLEDTGLPDDTGSLPEPPQPQFTQDEIDGAFEDLLLDARDDDRFIRQSYVSLWRRLEYYWNNILDIFLDPVTREWRVPDWSELEDEIPPRLINIYRPHGEAIVAALSVSVPSVIFHPDDADNPDDVEAAKAYRNLVELLALHNEAPMLFIRLIVIFFNQGTVFGYNYYHKDPKYGTFSSPKVEYKDIEMFEAYCPQCGEGLDAGVLPGGQSSQPVPPGASNLSPLGGLPSQPPQGAALNGRGLGNLNQPQPSLQGMINSNPNQMAPAPTYQCPTCGYNGPAQVNQSSENLPQIVGWDNSPKGSICQELFSGLQVKVPMYARKQEELGYLLLEFVQSVPMLKSIFKDNEKSSKIRGKRYQKELNQFLKLPLQYTDQMPDYAANVSCLWLRPFQFYQLGDKNNSHDDMIQYLLKTYPTGCYALFIDDELFDVVEENMDEHWTISRNPFSPSIHARPMGENLATIQDIRAQFTEIEIQTVEHGIPETFADPTVLDFNKYGEGRAKPGMMTQAKPKAGKSLADGFFSTKAATLSQEVAPLRESLDQDAQFVVGSFPSIYGGQAEGGSKTASEYSQSRAMALQRIGTFWKLACSFWSQFQSRSAVEFANVLKELNQDEKFTKREGNGFINIWIRSAALNGRIGRVEPEATEQLPTSWAQKKDAIAQLLTSGVQEIIQVLTHPNNAELMQEIIGVEDFYIPGQEDRDRQRKEFVQLSQGIPVPTNPQIDNAEIHIEVLKTILEGDQGEALPPEIMEVCMQHLMEHEQYMQQQAMMAAQAQAGQPNPQEQGPNRPRTPAKEPVNKPNSENLPTQGQ
jgi:hypothetical protein